MLASHDDADAEKGRLLDEQGNEGSSYELSGRSTPINRLASIDIEGLNDADVGKEATSTQERPQKNRAKLVAWITINTLATIGIVRFTPSAAVTAVFGIKGQRTLEILLTPCPDTDLHQQSHLLRPVLPTMSSIVRIIPLFRDGFDPVHPLETQVWHVRPGASTHPNSTATRYSNVLKCHFA